MSELSRFIGVRVEPEMQRKLILLSIIAGEPGNMSAGLRWALNQVRVSGEVTATIDGPLAEPYVSIKQTAQLTES